MKRGVIVGSVLFAIAAIVFIIALAKSMAGTTKTIGENPVDVTTKTINCQSKTIEYPFFAYDGSSGKNLNIRAEFRNDQIEVLSLKYTLFYNDARSVMDSENRNRAAMNRNLSKDGLEIEEYNAHYIATDSYFRMELYATTDELNDKAMRYFMLDANSNSTMLNTITEYQLEYEKQGFSCTITK